MEVLTSEPVDELVGLSASDKSRIKEVHEEQVKERDENLAELDAEIRNDLLDALEYDNQEFVKGLVGEDYFEASEIIKKKKWLGKKHWIDSKNEYGWARFGYEYFGADEEKLFSVAVEPDVWWQPTTHPFALLGCRYVSKELELSDSQERKLIEHLEKLNDAIPPEFKNVQLDLQKSMRPKLYEKEREIRKASLDAIDQILLPHQKKRLVQIKVQWYLSDKPTSQHLAHFLPYYLKEMTTLDGKKIELVLSNDEKRRIKERIVDVSNSQEIDIQQLTAKYRQSIVDVLVQTKKEKVYTLFGEDFFEVDPKQRD